MVLRNLSNLSRQESCFESNHIPWEVYDENAFIFQKTVSHHARFIITPLSQTDKETVPLKRCGRVHTLLSECAGRFQRSDSVQRCGKMRTSSDETELVNNNTDAILVRSSLPVPSWNLCSQFFPQGLRKRWLILKKKWLTSCLFLQQKYGQIWKKTTSVRPKHKFRLGKMEIRQRLTCPKTKNLIEKESDRWLLTWIQWNTMRHTHCYTCPAA